MAECLSLTTHIYEHERFGGRFAIIVIGESVIWEQRTTNIIAMMAEFKRVSEMLGDFNPKRYRVISCQTCNERSPRDLVTADFRCETCGRSLAEELRIAYLIASRARGQQETNRIIAESKNVKRFSLQAQRTINKLKGKGIS